MSYSLKLCLIRNKCNASDFLQKIYDLVNSYSKVCAIVVNCISRLPIEYQFLWCSLLNISYVANQLFFMSTSVNSILI